jgi:hypothetical protein
MIKALLYTLIQAKIVVMNLFHNKKRPSDQTVKKDFFSQACSGGEKDDGVWALTKLYQKLRLDRECLI